MNTRIVSFSIAAHVVLIAASGLVIGCAAGGGGGTAAVDASGTPVAVTRSFEQGQTMKYRFKVESQSGVKRVGYEQSIATSHELRTTCTITKAGDEKVEMDMRFDYAAGSRTVGDQMMADKDVATLRGKVLQFTLSPAGAIESWAGLSGEAVLESGAGQFAMLLYDVLPSLPAEPLTVGMTWTEPYNIPTITTRADRDFVGESTYTVLGFKRRYDIPCAEIRRVTNFEFEGRAEQGGEVWLMSGRGTTDGTMLISTEDGLVVWSSSNSNMTLKGEGASVASAAASGTVEMGIKSKLVIELQS